MGAFVTDLQKISAIVDSYAQHMGIQMTDIVISEVTLKKLYGLLSKAESQNFIQDTKMKFWRNLGLMRLWGIMSGIWNIKNIL